MKCYVCKKPFKLYSYDDNRTLKVKAGDLFVKPEGDLAIGEHGGIHLDGARGYWIEVSRDMLAQNFSTCLIPCISDLNKLWKAFARFGRAIKTVAEVMAEAIFGVFIALVNTVKEFADMLSYNNRRAIRIAAHRRKNAHKKKGTYDGRHCTGREYSSDGLSF